MAHFAHFNHPRAGSQTRVVVLPSHWEVVVNRSAPSAGRPCEPAAVVAVRAAPGPPGHGQVSDLAAGERVTFGSCRCGECAVDVVVAVPPGLTVAGAVTAYDDHWRLHNLSPDVVLLCQDLEDPTQTVRIVPGRVEVAMPFELSLVSVPGQRRDQALTVFAHEPTHEPTDGPGRRGCAPRTERTLRLSPGTAYFAVLEELCRPRLRGEYDARLPTSNEIAGRLSTRGVPLSRRAVDHHIDYLVERLGLAGEVAGGSRRDTLAREAVRLGLLSSAGRTDRGA